MTRQQVLLNFAIPVVLIGLCSLVNPINIWDYQQMVVVGLLAVGTFMVARWVITGH